MKLIGSKTEQDFRDHLIKSRKYIFEVNHRLLGVLRTHFPDMKTAYILFWVPEESEDIYTILVNDDVIADIEMDRVDHSIEPVIKTTSVSERQQGLRKMPQIQLAVAIDLAQRDMRRHHA